MGRYRKLIIEISLIVFLIIVIFSVYFLMQKDIKLTLNGKNEIILNVNEEYKENGIKAQYCFKYLKFKCIDLKDTIKTTNNINNKKLGNYNVTYNVTYKNKNKKIVRNVSVKDTEAPVITLITKDDTMYTCPNKEYIEEGYIVTDNYHTDLQDKVVITKTDTGIKYEVSDSSGNKTSQFREYKYDDKISPTINLSGYSYSYVELNKEYKEPGYSANDNCDGNITNKVIVSGTIDNTKEGTYPITYTVTDNKGNKTSVTRKVKVYEKKEYTETNPSGKVVYLTFDDGPCYYTGRLLELLDSYNIKATFFVTGQFLGYKDYIKQAYDRGHTIALHTYSHIFSTIYSSVDGYFNDIEKIDNVVYELTGEHPKLIRFAGGSSNTVSCGKKGLIPAIVREMEARGYKYYDWNVGSNDTGTINSTTIANNIINGMNSHNYSVVLQHDLKPASIDALSRVIEYGQANGFTFLPLTTESPTVQHSISKCHY